MLMSLIMHPKKFTDIPCAIAHHFRESAQFGTMG